MRPDEMIVLEQSVRAVLLEDARRVFPDQAAPPFRAKSDARQRVSKRWAAPLFSAAAVIAIVVTLISSGVFTRSHSRRPTPHPAPPASTVSGVQVIADPNDIRQTAINTDNSGSLFPKSLESTLTAGHKYDFTVVFIYASWSPDTTAPGVVDFRANSEALHCPGPFTVMPGHQYRVACSLIPHRGHGSLTLHIAFERGPNIGTTTTVPITAK